MHHQVILVTPDLARTWLGKNAPGNRKINMLDVRSMVDDMKHGKWELTHEGIAFNDKDELVDGQHRLTAIVISEMSVRMNVFTNLEHVTLKSNINTGRKRSISFLTGRSPGWCTIVNMLRILEAGVAYGSVGSATASQLEEEYKRWPTLIDLFAPLHSSRYLPSGVIAGLLYAAPLNEEAVYLFAEKVKSGERMEKGQAAYALWRWIDAKARVRVVEPCAFAALGAIAYELRGNPISHVVSGDSGYRFITTKRRTAGVPYTPIYADVDTAAPAAHASKIDIHKLRNKYGKIVKGQVKLPGLNEP